MKKYKLLKDLPDVKAGVLFELGKDKDAYYLTSDNTGTGFNTYMYPIKFVENNPEWFEEVKEKEYEILGFAFGNYRHGYLGPVICRNENGTFGKYETEEKTLINSELYRITKVRRLPDGEVFSVGDAAIDLYENIKTSIAQFFIKDDIMYAMFDDHSCSDLKYLTKFTEHQIDNYIRRTPYTYGKLYTQSELEEAEQKAFEAAKQIFKYTYSRGIPFRQHQFKTYQDYKNSKK